jgi:hypothetical protein
MVFGPTPNKTAFQIGRHRPCGTPAGKRRTVEGCRCSRWRHPDARTVDITPPEGGNHSNDLTTVDVSPGSGLGGGPPLGQHLDFDSQEFTGYRMGDELSSSPYQRTTSIHLEGPDRGTKSSAAE